MSFFYAEYERRIIPLVDEAVFENFRFILGQAGEEIVQRIFFLFAVRVAVIDDNHDSAAGYESVEYPGDRL